jgi:hypothetical protein
LASEQARVDSEGPIESDLCFEVIDRIVLDDWHADLEGEGSVIVQFASDPRVERKKKSSALAGDWIAEIHPNVGARIE